MKRALLTIREQPPYRRQAFEHGLKRLGYEIVGGYGKLMPAGPEDLLVLWNVRRGPDEAYARRWEQAGGTVLVSENGYLQQQDKTYYALATHGHNGSGWWPVGDDARFAKLGFALKPWRPFTEGYILVRDQRGIGSASMASPPAWGRKFADKLRRSTPREVVYMPHPGDKGKLEADARYVAGAGVVHIWSSALGVRALVEGCTVFHHAPSWVCSTASGKQDDDARARALENMAHAQFHFDEIASGEPFARFRDAGWGPRFV